MKFTCFFVAAPIVLITLYAFSLTNASSSNASPSPKAEITMAKTIMSPTTNLNCRYRSCLQKD